MSIVRVGSNLLVASPRMGSLVAIQQRLHRLSVHPLGRTTLGDIERGTRRVWIASPDAVPAAASGDIVVRYEPTSDDQAGVMLLRALMDALPQDRATINAVGRRIQKPIRIVTPLGAASPIL